MRSPHLYDTLRRFCLGAFAAFHRDLDSGADLPFAFEEHGSYGRPTLYEYRPLVRGFVEARVDRLYARDDVRSAVDDLKREPAARIFARAHEGVTSDESRALYRSVLVPLLVRSLDRGADEVPDAPGELADAVTALRLATAAPVAAGPVLFERLDWRPYGIRPVLPIAATAPPGEPMRLDPFRASVAVQLRPKLALADDDTGLGDALDRWELALFQDDPFRAEQLRQALGSALGDEHPAEEVERRLAEALDEGGALLRRLAEQR